MAGCSCARRVTGASQPARRRARVGSAATVRRVDDRGRSDVRQLEPGRGAPGTHPPQGASWTARPRHVRVRTRTGAPSSTLPGSGRPSSRPTPPSDRCGHRDGDGHRHRRHHGHRCKPGARRHATDARRWRPARSPACARTPCRADTDTVPSPGLTAGPGQRDVLRGAPSTTRTARRSTRRVDGVTVTVDFTAAVPAVSGTAATHAVRQRLRRDDTPAQGVPAARPCWRCTARSTPRSPRGPRHDLGAVRRSSTAASWSATSGCDDPRRGLRRAADLRARPRRRPPRRCSWSRRTPAASRWPAPT